MPARPPKSSAAISSASSARRPAPPERCLPANDRFRPKAVIQVIVGRALIFSGAFLCLGFDQVSGASDCQVQASFTDQSLNLCCLSCPMAYWSPCHWREGAVNEIRQGSSVGGDIGSRERTWHCQCGWWARRW